MAVPAITTYHHHCTQLLLATSTPLTSLPRREHSDTSIIIPLCEQPRILASSASSSTPSTSTSTDLHIASLFAPVDAHFRKPSHEDGLPHSADGAVIVRGEDGFEKRWLLRCTRCEAVVGYFLGNRSTADAGAELQAGRREDVLYLLDGAVKRTENLEPE